MNTHKTIGIIGGQGPVSTADHYMRIIKYYQDHFGAKFIRDYPPMIIYSVPTPDLVESIADENLTFSLIAEATKKLEQDGCAFIIITCNSLQYFIDRLQPLVKIPIIRIAKVSTDYVIEKGYKKVGILASYTTIKKETYSKYLREAHIDVISPNDADQKIVEQIILNIIGGEQTNEDKTNLLRFIEKMKAKGAESILLACTELPLLVKQTDATVPLIDFNELYAQEAAKQSY